MIQKIFNKEADIINIRRINQNKKIILCHGVFDLLHSGHIEHFKEAKKYGNILVVSVTNDKFIKKGIGRPVFNIDERASILSELKIVDYVIISNSESSEKNINLLKPDFYVKGKDYKKLSSDLTNKIKKEKKVVEACGGKIIFTTTELKSSSKFLFLSNQIYSKDTTKILLNLRKKYSTQNIINFLEKIKKLKVLIIGETIIDRYIFLDTVGKASKDPIIIFEKNNEKKILGGAASISLNCLALCPNVTFLTKIGSKNTVNYDFVIKKLKKIKLEAIKSSDQPINEKLRYVDKLSNKKLMGLYELDKDKKSFSNDKIILKVLKKINKYDLVIVYDYKHGLIDKTIAKKISSHKNNFINCQVNSSNQNEHNFNDYKNSNCIIINEGELRYELRDNNTDLKKIIRHFAKSYNIKNVIITQGSKGAILYKKKINTFFEIPPFANKVIDKVGAGDIILLLTSLFATVSNDYVLGSIIGSMFAAKALENFGNENVVSNAELIKFFSTFLD